MRAHRLMRRRGRTAWGWVALAFALALPAEAVRGQQPPAAPAVGQQSADADRLEAELNAHVRAVLGPPQRWPRLDVPDTASGGTPTPPSSLHKLDVTTLVSAMLADTEDVWGSLFRHLRRTYEEPRLVLYAKVTSSGCGLAQSTFSGPFYCEIDRRVYLDLDFFEELRARHAISGDMAQFYVIGHEIGHHVQRLLGILAAAGKLERSLDGARRNAVSVKVELQADCLAGVVAYHVHRLKQRLEPGDAEAGLTTASALGADRRAKATGDALQPESFTHGTSEQRTYWFRQGLESGDLPACDTFNAREL